MAKIKNNVLRDFEAYERRLAALTESSREIIGEVIYEGAAIAAEAVSEELKKIPVRSGNAFGTPEKPVEGLTLPAKQGLIDGFGISPMQDDGGFLNVKLGFDGYNSVKTKNFPKGQPNALVMRGLEGGTSWLKSRPTVRVAIRRASAAVKKKMEETTDEKIKQKMK